MTEHVAATNPSLLPYLDPGGPGLRLILNIAGGSPARGGLPTMPSGKADGFTSLMRGALGGGNEHLLGDLFLLIQPDHYHFQQSELQPVTNCQVENLWQAAFARLRRVRDDFSPVLPEQVDSQGRLLPWRPMVRCSKKARFGHLLCPHCGGGLDLCREDRLLKEAGLAVYSESLERFLFCPQCCQAGRDLGFYALFAPPGGPGCLRDGDYLIQSLGRLLTRPEPAGELPCVGCDGAGECFGPKNLVRERLQPLFFYPFHMFLQPAPSIHVLDFLELISGAAPDELLRNAVRQKNMFRLQQLQQHADWLSSSEAFLFPEDERRFGEVLFLKLTLLDELLALSLHSPDCLDEAVSSMSLEGVWVHLPVQTPRLPLYWNFSLRIVDGVGRPENEGHEGISPATRLRHFLGLAWCYVLLVNEGQGMAVVRSAVKRLLSEPGAIEGFAEGPLAGLDPVFGPANTWRSPGPVAIGAQWEGIWRRALVLGFELVHAEFRAEWPEEEFKGRLDALRSDIRHLLSNPAPSRSERAEAIVEVKAPPQTATVPVEEADRKIGRILSTILQQWPYSSAAKPPHKQTKPGPKKPIVPDADGDYQETVFLGRRPSTEQRAVKPPEPARDLMEETVMLGQPGSPDVQPDQPAQSFEETVLIHAPAAAPGKPDATAAPVATDDLEQTVMLGRPDASHAAGAEIEATIMVGHHAKAATPVPTAPKKENAAKVKETPEPADMEDLEQTVLLAPNSPKRGRTPS